MRKETTKILEEQLYQALDLLDKADEIILDIHHQITTYSKYTASRVYEWKDLRGTMASINIQQFDDSGRDEESLEQWKDNFNKGYIPDEEMPGFDRCNHGVHGTDCFICFPAEGE